ncbi:MAG TPA: amino acid adenylation domain-containing protein, partial [Pyrinomonadaceae bacterium]
MHDSPIEGFRLSPQQRRLWKLQEAEGADPFPALCAVSVEGVIVPETFRDAVEQTVRRHEILRTTFHLLPRMDAPIQAVGEGRFDFTQIPAPKERPPGGEQALIDTLVEEAARLPFDLKNGPVLRLTLHALSDSTHLLIVTLPALCADVLTLTKLVGEIAKAYTALLSGEQHAAETIQYADVSEWQNELLEAEDAHAGKDYWRRQELHTARPLSLFDEHPGGEQAVYDPRRFRVMLPASVMAEVKALAFEYTCSPQAVVLSCWQAVLWRLTGESEVVVSAAFKGRQYAELEDGLGLFAKYLPVRALLKEDLTFADLTKAVEASLDESGRWQEYFIEDGGTRSEGKTGTLGVGFEFIEWPRPINAGGLSFSFRRLYSHFDRFKVKLTCHQTDDALLVEFQYDGALLRQQTIERLAANLQTLLTDALARPRAAIQSLDILGSDERRALLYEFNATATAQPTSSCFHTVFERQVEETPDAAAVSVGRTTYSYRELNERANKLARRLREAGVGPEVLVGILLSRSVEMVVGLLGVLKAGGAYVPFDISQPARRLGFMLEDAGVTLLLCHESTSDTELPPHLKLMRLDADWAEIESYSAGNLPPSALPDNLAYVIYTSGSTGRPKGVQVTHASLVNLLSSMQRIPGLTSSDTLLAVTTISFDIAALELFLPLVTGARLVIATRDEAHDAGRLAGLLSDFSVTVMQATPATWRLLVESGWAGSAGLKILCGGEALARSLAEELVGRGAAVWNLYGPTETTIWSAAGRVDGGTGEGLVSVGGPIANTQMYVLDAELEPAPVGVVGELYIGGEGLARGYLNRPELTAERFVPHPHGEEAGARLYRTGDVARYRSDGGMEVVGRMDQQVKLRGHRIELGEVESALCGHPEVREAAVVVRERRPGDQRLVAYLVSGRDARPAAAELSGFVRRSLPEFMAPSSFVYLDALPRHPNGKVNRPALPEYDDTTAEAGASGGPPQTQLEGAIADIWKDVLGVAKVSLRDNFFDLGGHSLLLAQVHRRLREVVAKDISLIEMFRHPTVAALAGYLNNGHNSHSALASSAVPEPAVRRSEETGAGTEVAIIGMTGRFPGAKTVDEFWRNLRDGVESITFFSDEELAAEGCDPALLRDPKFIRAGATLDGVELFDAKFFGFSPREAEVTDPQHRLFLECAWEAMENAGYDPARFGAGVGVYASAGMNTYLLFNLAGRPDLLTPQSAYQTFIGNDKDFLTTRVSYKLNLKGPSVNVQTACSSSLVAVHLACQSLLNRECDMALAGGVAVKVPAKAGYLHDEQGIDSPDGHCRAFDAKAAGTVFGSGVGVVVLKRLADALSDGDYIHAVIKGSAVNNDGSNKISYTAPSEAGQAEVISMALAAAGVEPETIGYVETHGTGTHLGDPIEIAALTKAFGSGAQKKGYCAVGSVKTNIGHLDTAAGVAGLIKAVLALKNRELPPLLHFEQPNPQIDFAGGPFYVNEQTRAWEQGPGPRRAGVSSFGIGGTNAHVILEEAPAPATAGAARPWQLLTVSAKTEPALELAADALAAHLKNDPDASLPDVAYTLHVGRQSFEHRRLVVCRDAREAVASIERMEAKRVFTGHEESASRPVAFLFPGQGTQHVGMARELYQTEPSFRRTVDECSELLRPRLGLDLRAILYPSDDAAAAERQLEQTRLAQPALFVVEYALARLWEEWGVRPRAMLGHSIGEYVAACLAGVFSLENALALVAARGRLMQSMPAGAMLAASLAEDEARALLNEQLSLAAVNGASQCVFSGETQAVERLEAELNRRGLACRRLHTSHAFHSVMMEPVAERLADELARVKLEPPRRAYLSNLTGDWITPREATDPNYWVRQLRETVRFSDGLGKLLETPEQILLEVGPGQSLATQTRRHPKRHPQQTTVSSLRHPHDSDSSDAALLLTALGQIWLAGVPVDWPAYHTHERRRRVPLPTYPFERQRYWVDPVAREDGGAHESLRKRPNLSEWFYLPCWKPAAPARSSEAPREHARRLVLINKNSFCTALLRSLEEQSDDTLVTVQAGEHFAKHSGGAYVVNPHQPGDYRLLLDELRRDGNLPHQVLHLWNLSAADGAPTFDQSQSVGFGSLLQLGKVLGEIDEPLEIVVVSNGLQCVTGEEELHPEKATLLGPCKTIPQEYPHLTCRSIDVAMPLAGSWQEQKLCAQLVA